MKTMQRSGALIEGTKIMRKTSMISGGTYDRPYGGSTYLAPQQVRILRAHERRQDEDIYVVTSMLDNREVLVPGCELDPHPELPETNVEMVTRLMECSRGGTMMQVFVLTAIEKYAALVKAMTPAERASMDAGMVRYAFWERLADEAALVVNDHLKAR